MSRETIIISIWVLLIAVYITKEGLNVYFKNEINNFSEEDRSDAIFTPLSLSSFNGKESSFLYLSILGIVFDVTSGIKHYGPGASYNFFIGKDATRSFVDGNFECKKNCDDVTGFDPQELRSLDNWIKFYSKNYKQVGKLIGKYYNQKGNLTAYGKEVQKLIKNALEEETEEDRLKLRYPGCNMEWDRDRGTHVWCTDQSGGIKRNWVGLPRKFFMPGSKMQRCACIKEEDLSIGKIQEYEGCDPKSTDCYFKT